MHVEPHTVLKRSFRERMSARLQAFNRFGTVMIFLIVVAVVVVVLLPNSSIIHVMASSAVLSKPNSIDGTAGSQQVSLSWGAARDATGYIIEQTDLVTGQVQQLPTVV